MRIGSVVLLTPLVLLIAMPAFGQVQPKSGRALAKERSKPQSVPRAADGHSDIQGVWSFANLTPLERPAEFGNKAVLTDAEAAAYAKRIRDGRNMDRRDGGGDADVARA